MIFFRAHTVRLKHQRENEIFFLFGKLKAYFSAPVNELSGMTVNLQDVDRWMAAILNETPAFEHFNEALQYFFKELQKKSSAFRQVEISVGAVSSHYDGKEFSRTYSLRTWFKQNQTWVQRPVKLKSKKLLSKKFRSRLRLKKWSTTENFAKILNNHLPGLIFLEVQNPDWGGSEKFHF